MSDCFLYEHSRGALQLKLHVPKISADQMSHGEPMRSEIRELRARRRRLQIGIMAAGAILVALAILLFDALISP